MPRDFEIDNRERLLGKLLEGTETMKEAIKDLGEKVESHGLQLAKGEQNFEIISENMKEIKEAMHETNDKVDQANRNVDKVACCVTDLVKEFKECRKSKGLNNTCDIKPLDPMDTKDKPSIIINIPKFDFTPFKNPIPYFIILVILLAATGVKFHSSLIEVLKAFGGSV